MLNVRVDTSAPVAPKITAFTPDTGTVGDGITSANRVTLTGTAEAGSTVKVFDGTNSDRRRHGQYERKLELPDRSIDERKARFHGHSPPMSLATPAQLHRKRA